MQVCMVNPCPHPARRYLLPNSSPTRKGSAGSSPLPSNPMADLDTTNEMLRSSPSLRRWRKPDGPPRGERSTHTPPSLISTGPSGPRRQTGRTFRRSRGRSAAAVAGEDAVLQGAPVQGEAHVGTAIIQGVHPTVMEEQCEEWPATRTEVRPAARTSSNLAARTKLSERVSSSVSFPVYTLLYDTNSAESRSLLWPGCSCDGRKIDPIVLRAGSIADGRRLVYEGIVGELPHQEVGDVCPRDVGRRPGFRSSPTR